MDIMASQERLNKNWVWKYFLKLDNSFIKCNIYSCDQTYKIQYGKIKRTIAIAKRHLYHLHNIWNEEDRLKWENDNDLIWRYFDKIGLYKVKCKFCGSFYCQAYIPCLRQHLQNHSQEMKDTVRKEIVDKSLLQYFEIDEEFNAHCKRCNLKINLLYGKDVLRYHICFKKYVCNSKYQLEDNNVNRMRQQSIPEKTGTSSHHDINRQAPRNKNQQR
ncbi:hypothetical protein ALC56_01531 [Trachymyrmex septentrionalis]|uniref:BED-type domain-containing protein n=1 Tax=Trachymyrmex septentrionalis TaxID=34720 RepID=A0A195FU58_9HYME|nr:hypothetical protein ALC56_01531 [Trachymyrmex septentrionalis]